MGSRCRTSAIALFVPVGSFLCGAGWGQAPSFEWAVRAGGASFDVGSAVAVDASGSVYTAGEFSGTVDFDGTGPLATLVSVGEKDVFVAKLDPVGVWLWVAQVEGSGGRFDDFVDGIAVDALGAAHVTGTFAGTAGFGSTSLTSAGNQDAFIAKIDPNGVWQWAVRAGGVFSDAGYGVAVDTAGNVYATGQFFDTAEFGEAELAAVGFGDLFAAKLDADGQWLWARRAGGADLLGSTDSLRYDAGFAIAVDEFGSAYVTGKFYGLADFGPHTLISEFEIDEFGTAIFSEDVFIAKLDTEGIWLWANEAGGTSADHGLAIAVDPNGQSYITGYFQHSLFIDPVLSIDSVGVDDSFVAKAGAAGNWLWWRSAGGDAAGSLRDAGCGIAVDAVGDAYITGYFAGQGHFGATTLNAGNSANVWAAKVDAIGNWQWARQAGGVFNDYGFGISLDGIGVARLTGALDATVSFDATILTTNGWLDSFVAELSEPLSEIAATVRDAFGLLDLNGNGTLDRDEAGLGIRTFDALDANGDNRITLAELLAASAGAVGVANPVHVDFGYSGTEMGTAAQPFDSLIEGANFVAPGGVVLIAPGNTPAALRISGPMALKRDGTAGVVRIGPAN